jgi:hypothetical protein
MQHHLLGILSVVFLAHPLHPLHLDPGAVGSQAKLQFRARLSVVPIDVTQQNTVAGNGAVTATLTGPKLTVAGTFSNLKSPATIAKIHVGSKGIRGPALFDLTVSKATSGTLEGTFDLTPQQVDDLTKSRFYIQLHSEKAPEGNLWGWLLPQEGRK